MNMEFDRSTQARSWIFDERSLARCRERAAGMSTSCGTGCIRKFASGYHRRGESDVDNPRRVTNDNRYLSSYDQEVLVRFHAHQIQTLVGPTALLFELCTSETVLSTAIMLFRRFYLSNSVLEFNPRKMATACAFFAAKMEDEKVQIELLSHATAVVQLRVQNAPLVRKELRTVSKAEIEEGELELMEGLNYEFICHHPDSAIRVLSLDFCNFLSSHDNYEERNDGESCFSPRSSADSVAEWADEISEKASDIAQRALVSSDVCFLFAPGHIAFAVVAIVLNCFDEQYCMGKDLCRYLAERFSRKKNDELLEFTRSISRAIRVLLASPLMDLSPADEQDHSIATKRAEELRRVIAYVDCLRQTWKSKVLPISPALNKRSRLELEFTPPRDSFPRQKLARVTPTGIAK